MDGARDGDVKASLLGLALIAQFCLSAKIGSAEESFYSVIWIELCTAVSGIYQTLTDYKKIPRWVYKLCGSRRSLHLWKVCRKCAMYTHESQSWEIEMRDPTMTISTIVGLQESPFAQWYLEREGMVIIWLIKKLMFQMSSAKELEANLSMN